jgi:probable HAF family extracellular repeat protein
LKDKFSVQKLQRIFAPECGGAFRAQLFKERFMKSRFLMCSSAITLFAGLAIPQLAAQEHPAKHHQYKLNDMGTFGGPESNISGAASLGAPNQINSHGTTVGTSATSIPSPPHSNFGFCGGIDGMVHFVFHAFQWQNGKVTDLEALPGHHNCSLATSINATGEIVGDSEISVVDPVLGYREIRAVRWKNGKITNIGTFGGKFSVMTAIDDLGQVAGSALNATPTPTPSSTSCLQVPLRARKPGRFCGRTATRRICVRWVAPMLRLSV